MAGRAKHLTIRNVPRAIIRALERERRRKHTSLNRVAIDALTRAMSVPGRKAPENGLVALAGTWSEADFLAFQAVTTQFDQVDDQLWK